MPASDGRKVVVAAHFGWGIFRYRLELARALVRAGYEVIAVADWSDGDYERQVRAAGIATESISLTRSRFGPLSDLRTLLQFVSLYRRLRPGAAFHFNARIYLLGGLAARIARVPVIVNGVNGIGIVLGGAMKKYANLYLPLYKAAFGGKVLAVFQNTSDRERMIEAGIVPRERTFHVPGSGVDTEALKPDPAVTPEARNLVVMACRMVWPKGVKEFVEAAELLKPRFPHIRFILAGGLSGDYGMRAPDDVPREWLRAAEARGAVEWAGHVEPAKLEDMFRHSAAVVLPSFYPEGVPRCLIEGAAAGAPIVTTDTPGCRDIVVDGVSGRLAPPRDSARFAEALAEVIATPETVGRMGAQSRKLAVDVFDANKISAAYEAIARTAAKA
ncbi:MAG TPA: glycosyltransferase family 4 protein [Rhizomicrobium sp.]|nr:glycosyltransferase family 4 protein [Rhizomicrobium sp.]